MRMTTDPRIRSQRQKLRCLFPNPRSSACHFLFYSFIDGSVSPTTTYRLER
jgi:hypothetical protein